MGMAKEVFLNPIALLIEMSKNKPEFEVEDTNFSKTMAAARRKSAGKGFVRQDDAKELERTFAESDEKMYENQRLTAKNFVKIFLSDRTISTPNIPIISDILFRIKAKRCDAKIEEAKEKLVREQDTTDSVIKAATATNGFTNHSGKGVVKTTAAVKGDKSNPREQGGEIRTRKGR